MTDKTISINTELDPKPSARFERAFKEMGQKAARALNPKAIADWNKQVEKGVKSYEKLFKIDKSFTQHLKTQSQRILKEQEKAYANMGKEIDRVRINLERVNQVEKRIESGAIKTRYGISLADLRQQAPGIAAGYEQRLRGKIGAYQSGFGGQIMQGADILAQRASDEQAQKQEERFRRSMMLMRAGAVTQLGGQVISGVGNLMFGAEAKELGFQVTARSAAGNLYNQLTSGDITPMWALAQSGNLDRMQKIVSNARKQGISNAVGGVTSDVGKAMIGAAQVGASIGSGGAADMFNQGAVAGMGNIAGGAMSAAGTIQDIMLGKLKADQANSFTTTIQQLGLLNPVQLRGFQELVGRQRQLHELGALTGLGPTAAVGSLSMAGAMGGLNLQETLPLFQQLRGAVGTNAAMGLLGGATTALDRMGISRESAMGALGTFTTGTLGGAGGAMMQLEGVMRRAMKEGITDSRLREVFAAGIADMARTVGGRAGGVEGLSASIMQEANRLGGGKAGMAEVQIAMGGAQAYNAMTGGRSNINPLNVAIAASRLRSMGGRIKNSFNKLALSNMGATEIANQSAAFRDIMVSEGIIDPKAQAAFANRLLGATRQGVENALPGATTSPGGRYEIGRVQGTDYETTTAGLNIGRSLRAGEPLLTGALGPAHTQDQTAIALAQQKRAALENRPIISALETPGAIEKLERLTTAAVTMAQALERTKPEDLENIPKLLSETADSLREVGQAAKGIWELTHGGISTPIPTEAFQMPSGTD